MILRALDGRSILFLGVLLLLAIGVPALNQAGFIPNSEVQKLGKWLSFALLAIALDLVWGYCGLLSLGHGAFFALGGYAIGLHMIPEGYTPFQWSEQPWFWQGFDSLPYALVMVFLIPGVLGFAFGYLAFRSRVTGVYFSIITQAMTYALGQWFNTNATGFNGENGLTDFQTLLGFDVQTDATRTGLFIVTVAFLAAAFLLCRLIVTSKAGKVLVAVRDAESRTRFLGYRVEHYKLFVFTVSAMLAGMAGALYAPQAGIINPSEFSPANSILIVIWVAVGGRGTLVGAAIGAVLISAAESFLTGWLPEIWVFVLGAIFILATLFLPRGVVGVLESLRMRRATSGGTAAPQAAE